jgi:hypothetical protein
MVNLRLSLQRVVTVSLAASGKSKHRDSPQWNGTRLIHSRQPVLSGICVTAQALGRSCSLDTDCVDPESDVQIFCSPGGICGGGRAECEPDWSSTREIGESRACISGKSFTHIAFDYIELRSFLFIGVCKGDNKCANPGFSRIGRPCNTFYDCTDGYVECSPEGICGGGGAYCTTYTGFYPTGQSYECASCKSTSR